MGLCLSTTPRLRFIKRCGQSTISDWSLTKQQSPKIVSIHILDDDSLLNVFHLYRPCFLGEDENNFNRLLGGDETWAQGCWWYRLAHVCQRWRNLILVMMISLQKMKRGYCLLSSSVLASATSAFTSLFRSSDVQKLVMAIDEEFPILEYLIMGPLPENSDNTALRLPETLQAPNLHHLTLGGFACPMRPRLHPIAAGLVTLCLITHHQFAYFQPN
ncbi:hypothetical protein BGY98DRAFT_1174506, partial [Russula aff. rugulosa BPL654]